MKSNHRFKELYPLPNIPLGTVCELLEYSPNCNAI